MQYVLSDDTVEKFVEYGTNVWDIDKDKAPMEIAEEAIAKTRQFFDSIGMPSHLRDLGIDETHFETMAEKAADGGLAHGFIPLNKEDVMNIYKMAL